MSSKPSQTTDYRKVIESIAARESSPISVFQDFVAMAACALAAGTREEEYLDIAKRYERDQLNTMGSALGMLVNESQDHPFEDRLGPYYLEIASEYTKDVRGEFYTPQSVSDLVAMMTVNVEEIIRKGQPVTVQEPACGAGGMILSLAKQLAPNAPDEPSHVDLLRVTAIDINQTACHMTYINTTLWGIPTKIIWWDTLRWQLHKEWNNIHWYRVGQHEIERARHMIDAFNQLLQETDEEDKEQKSDLTLPPDPNSGRYEQMELF